MRTLLIVLALALPWGPLDPPGVCVGSPNVPGGAADLTLYDTPAPPGWRLWASVPAWTTTLDELGMPIAVTVSLTQSLDVPAGTTFLNAFALQQPPPPFWLYLCVAGDLPPGGGYRVLFADVRG